MLYKLQCFQEAFDRWYFNDEAMGIERELFYPDTSAQLSRFAHGCLDEEVGEHTLYVADYQFHKYCDFIYYVGTDTNGDVKTYNYWQPNDEMGSGLFQGTVTLCAVLEQYFPQIPDTIWFMVNPCQWQIDEFFVPTTAIVLDQ